MGTQGLKRCTRTQCYVGSGKSAKITFNMAAVSAESDHEELPLERQINVCLEAFEALELGCNLEFLLKETCENI